MAVAYYKIFRALIKQNKRMKRVCSNAVRSRYVQNRRTFLACLGTVLCFGVGSLSGAVWSILLIVNGPFVMIKYDWIENFAELLRDAAANSLNPLIYEYSTKRYSPSGNFASEENKRQLDETIVAY